MILIFIYENSKELLRMIDIENYLTCNKMRAALMIVIYSFIFCRIHHKIYWRKIIMSELFDTLNMIIIHFPAWMTIIIIIVQNTIANPSPSSDSFLLSYPYIHEANHNLPLHFALLGPSLLN